MAQPIPVLSQSMEKKLDAGVSENKYVIDSDSSSGCSSLEVECSFTGSESSDKMPDMAASDSSSGITESPVRNALFNVNH